MRIETKEVGIYTFSELPDCLQEQIIEKRRYWEVEDNFWYESTLDWWKDKLQTMGFEDPDIWFSGFYSQGDGASFTAWCDHQKILNTLFICNEQNIRDLKRWRLWFEMVENGPYFRFGIRRNSSRYSHKHTITPFVEEDMAGFTHSIYEAFDDRGGKYYTSVFDRKLGFSDLEAMFEDFVRDLCDEIYKSLEQEYEYYTSDEYLKEWLNDSGEEFRVNLEEMELE